MGIETGVTLEQAIEDWLARLTLDRSPATIAGYGWELRRFALRHVGRAVGGFTPADLVRYLADRRLSGAGDATVKRSTAALRAFFAYARGADTPASGLPLPRKPRPVRRTRVLTAAQAEAVLASCETTTARGRRDLALVSLMLATGLRAAEVCRLRLDDVDWATGRFSVLVKGGQRRPKRFGPATGHVLRAWLDSRAGVAATGIQTLFVGIGGRTPGGPLTPAGLRAVFREIGRRAGLAAFAPHDLRRSFATLALRNGAPTRIVQAAGGWDRIEQLEAYSREIGLDDFAAFDPAERLLGGGPR